MKIFLDTNVLLDILAHRAGESAAREIVGIFANSENSRIYCSFLSVADAAYVLRKNGTDKIKRMVSDLHSWCDILGCTDFELNSACKIESPDYEDCLQIATAESKNVDVILTRNTSHFRSYTEIPVLSPDEFLGKITASSPR